MDQSKLNLANIKALAKSPELKSLRESWILEKALLETLKPRIVAIYQEALSEFSFSFDDKRDADHGKRIEHYKDLYRTDEDTSAFYERAKQLLEERGWLKDMSSRDICPLLSQEDRVRQIERKVINLARETFGLPEIYNITIEQQLLDITLRLA